MLSQLSQAHPNAASARSLPLLSLSGKAPRGRGRLSEDVGILVQSLKVLPPWASAPRQLSPCHQVSQGTCPPRPTANEQPDAPSKGTATPFH